MTKWLDRPFLLSFSLSFSTVCILTVIQPAGWTAVFLPYSVLLFFAALSGGILFKRKERLFTALAALCLIICATAYAGAYSRFRPTLEKRYITGLTGRLWLDSSCSSNGNLVLHLTVSEVENSFGNSASCGGTVTAVYKQDTLLCTGSTLHLTGRFSEDLFVCDSLEVVEKGPLEYIRSHLILLVSKRLSGFRLGRTLVLGRLEKDSPDQDLVDLAQSCGCMHVLALSGMHLGIIGNSVYAVVKKLAKRTKIAKFFAILAASFFVFVAGPRPSLLRAWLYYILFFTDYRERNACAFFLHLSLVPYSIFTQGAAYGYVSIAAIITFAPLVTAAFRNIMPRALASPLGTSIAVVVYNAPLQMLLTGEWHPSAIIAGPPAALLVSVQMALCLAGLAFPGVRFFPRAAEYSSSLLQRLFTLFSSFPASGLKGYILLLVFCLVSVIIRSTLSGGKYGKRIHG